MKQLGCALGGDLASLINKSMGLALILVISSYFIISEAASSDQLSPQEIYRRCYIRMTRQLPTDTDALLVQVSAGSIAPEEACAKIFDLAKLSSQGVLVNRTDATAQAVLRTFHDLHSSWFKSRIHPFPTASLLVRDSEEAPLYFTRAAFLTGAQFSSVVTHNTGLQGIRDQVYGPDGKKRVNASDPEANGFLSQRILSYGATMPYAAETDLILAYNNITYSGGKVINNGVQPIRVNQSKVTQTGNLVGVAPSSSLVLPSFRLSSTSDVEVKAEVLNHLTNFESNRHFGGGVIGSQSFLLNNTNLTNAQIPNGSDLINRRITSRVFEDLLCHQLPTLTDSDVAAEVIPTSPHAFQQTSSCMRCHSSIDGLGYGLRQLVVYTTAANPSVDQQVGVNYTGFGQLNVVPGANHFALHAPTGTLHYRELVTGNRVKKSFDSLSELGAILAGQADLYTCAAKRYYQFFTGVDVDLTQVAEDEVDKFHQDKVLQFGLLLRSSQNVRTLLKAIFSSDAFKTRNYKTKVKQ